MSLLKYIIKRIFVSIPILIIALTITFFIGRALPGNPFLAVFSRGTDAEHELYELLLENSGLNDPILVQYVNFLINILSGDWGTSMGSFWREGPDVRVLIANTLPISVEIIFLSSILAYFLGKRIGIYTATRKNKKSSNFVRILTAFGAGIPNVILGLVLILIIKKTSINWSIIGIKTFLYPDPPRVTGMRLLDCLIGGEFHLFFDSLIHYFWPVAILGLQFGILLARQTRSNLMNVLEEDYIRTARAKGCNEKQIIKNHAYTVALIPNIAYLGILFPVMLSNLMLMDFVFEIPGFGSLLYQSFYYLDYNVQIVCISVSIIAVISMNLITDVLYAVMDPRIRYD